MNHQLRVAFDLGGVIAPKMTQRQVTDGEFSLEPGPEEGAFETVAKLVKKLGAKKCYIISRVSSDAKADAAHDWLRHWGFFEKTGFLEANVIVYVGDRQQKAEHVRVLGINVMVDDRYEVLSSMDQGVKLVAFRPDPLEQNQFAYQMKMRLVRNCIDWRQIEHYFGL